MSAASNDAPPSSSPLGGTSAPASSSSSHDGQPLPSAFERWRRKAALLTGIGVSPEERAADQMAIHCNGCEQWKSQLLQHSPSVLFMLKHLKLSGCEVPPQNIICAPCGPLPKFGAFSAPPSSSSPASASSTSLSTSQASTSTSTSTPTSDLPPAAKSGGFSPEAGAIVLCAGTFFSKTHMENTLVHELVHMYDHCRFKVDWSDLRHHACSEIRANSLSGDCRYTRELRRGFASFSKQHQACVRRRAAISVASNPSCPDMATAERAVNEVWDSCFNDTRPFDEIY